MNLNIETCPMCGSDGMVSQICGAKKYTAIGWESEKAELQAENERLLKHLRYLVSYAKTTGEHWDADRDAKVGKRLAALGGDLTGYDAKLDELFVKYPELEHLNWEGEQ